MGSGSLIQGKHRYRLRFAERFQRWINRRIPPSRSVTLNQRRIFIFPSAAGLFFMFCLLVMLLTAINFQNNLSYALTFLLATLFIVATLHTYANLSGLTIQAVRAVAAFPGQRTEFELLISKGRQRRHYALHCAWPDSSDALVNLTDQESARVVLHMPVGERGWYKPGRLLLESTYPLGLLRCWTWLDLDLHALVYPRPLPTPELPGTASQDDDGAALLLPGSDDFYALREYRQGDPMRQIHWKGLAKGQGLHSKEHTAYAQRSAWLDWEQFAGLPTEQRLSHLCFWALDFHKKQEEFGLQLPALVIAPGTGDKHLDAVLRALALYGKEPASA